MHVHYQIDLKSFSLAKFKRFLQTRDLIPSRRSLKEALETRFRIAWIPRERDLSDAIYRQRLISQPQTMEGVSHATAGSCIVAVLGQNNEVCRAIFRLLGPRRNSFANIGIGSARRPLRPSMRGPMLPSPNVPADRTPRGAAKTAQILQKPGNIDVGGGRPMLLFNEDDQVIPLERSQERLLSEEDMSSITQTPSPVARN